MGGCGGCQYKGMSTAVERTFVGVRFAKRPTSTLCSTGDAIYGCGERVVVERQDGLALGHVEKSPMPVFKPCQKSSASGSCASLDDDVRAWSASATTRSPAKRFCQEQARDLGLEMKVSRVDFPLFSREAIFYFTSEGRVDFRQLVRDLSQRFRLRVKMQQVGARDEAALLGGIGVCGKTLCCSTWLKDFKPIFVRMAKRQNLRLNPSKISGQCGRLLCCLAYEDDDYRKHGPLVGAAPQVVGGRVKR